MGTKKERPEVNCFSLSAPCKGASFSELGFSISGIERAQAHVGITLGSGKSRPLRALCFPLSRYRAARARCRAQEGAV